MTILYCRKSTESEDRQVLSIESQISELTALAKRDGLKIDKIFTENKSAKAIGRPEFEKMMSYVCKHKNSTILSWKLDRLSRNSTDAGRVISLLENGTVKEIKTYEKSYLPSDNVLLMYVELGMANQFLRDLSQNVKRGQRAKLAKGEWIGVAPVGYLNDKANHTVHIDQDKSHYIVKMFEMFSTGGYTTKEIASILYDKGFRTKGGNKIHQSKVYHILNNPFYAGTIRVKGSLYAGSHTPLISQTLFDSCQRVFSPNRTRKQRHDFPLRGHMTCAVCNCALTATSKKGITYYYCTNGKKWCSQHKSYMRSEVVDKLIASLFRTIRVDRELIEIMYLAAKEKIAQNGTDIDLAKDSVQLRLGSLAERQNRLLDVYLADKLDIETYESKSTDLSNEKVELENQLKQLENSSGRSTLEQTKKAFLTAFNAEKDFLSADDNKKSELVKILLWNASIKDKEVQSFELKQPFQLMAEATKSGDISSWHGL